MIPNATQDRAEALLQLYAEAEEKLLGIIARQLGPVKGDPESWARRKLAQVQQLHDELEGAISELEKRSLEERVKLMWAAHDEGADGLLRELGLDDARSARSQASVALIDDANERFSELHRRILHDATDVYRDVLAKALPQAVFGVETTQQAVSRALAAFADRGITAFVDKAGRHWGMAEYAEMAVRTGMMNSALAGYAQEALAHGEDLVIISEHADECPLCAPWERRILSITGAQRDHPDCTGTVGDARAAGLFHPNCLHAMTVYVPGLTIAESSKPPGPYQDSADARGYSKRQQQRYMERMVRRWKRRQAVATTPEEERLARAYVVKWQGKLRSVTADVKLPRKYSREGGRVLLSDATKKLKPLILKNNRAIIPLSDIPIIRNSVGSKSISDYSVMDLASGEFFKFAQGSRLKNVQVFAGKGVNTPFRKAQKYADRYGGDPENWQHVKGFGVIEAEDGERDAEVHWVQCEGVGRHDFFIKRWLDED